MKLRPSTRHFLVSAAIAGSVLLYMLVRMFARLAGRPGGPVPVSGPMLVELALFGLAFVVGVAIAWFRLLSDRRARRNRRPPLNL